MPGIAKPLQLRLFLEGLEVPVVSAQVTSSINGPAAAAVQIIPTDSALDFHPRTMVHLFILETRAVPVITDEKASLADYRLLFAGEVVAYQSQQTPQSRGLILQCLDFSSYWDTAHSMAIEYGPAGNAFTQQGAVIGARISLFDDIVSHHAERLVGWLKVPPGPKTPGLKTVSGLAGGIIKILEAMAGVPNYTKGVNDFFTVAELRCHILEQIVAEEHDQTAEKLLSVQVFEEWLLKGLQNAGQQTTFRDILKLLFEYIYYEVVPNPSAKFTEASGDRTQQLNAQIIRPDCWFAPPPVCNVIFPEQYVSLSHERNFIGEVTRVLIFLYSNVGAGPDELLANKILAPNFLDVLKPVKGTDASYRVLLPHELHTGIVPRQEKLPDTAAVYSTLTVNGKTPEGQRLTWAQNVALFHFFKYRFAPRMAAVGGKLNYNVVCGFPAAVIRAPFIPNVKLAVDVEDILDDPASFGAPQHLIGMVSYVSHNVDQAGGTTTIQLHHVRSHRGVDDEFLRMAQRVTGTQQLIKVILDYDEIAKSTGSTRDQLLRFLAGVTPQTAPSDSSSDQTMLASQTTAVSELTSSVDPSTGKVTTANYSAQKTVTSESQVKPSSSLPLTEEATFQDEVGLSPKPAGKISRGHVGVFGDGKVSAVRVNNAELVNDVVYGNMFRRVTIYQEVTVPNLGTTPLEEIFRPKSWFSPKYANDLIGGSIYRPFFGCQSVIDALRYEDGSTGSEATSSADESSTMPTVSAVTGTAFVQQLAVKAADKNSRSIERALDHIAYFYGRVKTGNGDVDEFIQQYTRREIALMEDLLGSDTLEFTIQKNGKAIPVEGTGRVGFHSSAISPQLVNSSVKLAGLVNDLSLPLPRMGGVGKASTIPAEYDVRKEKWDRVNDYRVSLMQSRGLQG